MAGTIAGGEKAMLKNKQLYGVDFPQRIGRKGGKISRGGGFASDKVGEDGLTGKQRASQAGVVGGKVSQRGPSKRSEVSVLTSEDTIPNRFSKLSGIRKFFDR